MCLNTSYLLLYTVVIFIYQNIVQLYCVNNVLKYIRDLGFSGIDCSVANQPCDSNPCYNGGTCMSVGGTQFNCTCAGGAYIYE